MSLAKVGQHKHQETLMSMLTSLGCPAPSNTSGLDVPSVDFCLQVQANYSRTLIWNILLQDPTAALKTPLVQGVVYSSTLIWNILHQDPTAALKTHLVQGVVYSSTMMLCIR
ncbi:uncharacterized protein LOC108670296 [Hyalella azteca]|uniref:Uncharacterized protein LOC108670296 n=1 Tax=Hyalella azteca TaxID=294128 RepID=A0A8B7NHX7_HYAAZ|nr:uncharacterized protein LOC108670296 [Hyalella azteca]